MREDAATAELENLAAQDDVLAMLELSRRLINGIGAPPSPEKAVPWLVRAAETGNAAALCALGTLYELEKGVPRDMQKALDFYKKAFDAGDGLACYRLGRLFDLGEGVARNAEHAAAFYEEGAKRNQGDCQYYLALRSLEGRGLPRDAVRALDLLEQAGHNGVPAAFEVLGTIYLEGITVPRNPEMAFDCFSQALLYFDSDAYIASGDCVVYFALCLLLGEGCAKDKDTALKALATAAEDGNLIAKQVLEEKIVKNPLTALYFGHDAAEWDISPLLA